MCWSDPSRVSKTCSTFSSIYTWPCCLWHQHCKCQSKTRLSPSHNCQRLCWLSSRRLWSRGPVLNWQFLGGRQSIYFVWFGKCFRLVCALWPNSGKTQRPLLFGFAESGGEYRLVLVQPVLRCRQSSKYKYKYKCSVNEGCCEWGPCYNRFRCADNLTLPVPCMNVVKFNVLHWFLKFMLTV